MDNTAIRIEILKVMKEFLIFLGVVVAWVVLQKWVLPRFGVST